MSKFLDETRPFGRTLGHDTVCYKQDGLDFDSKKKVIAGSFNSGKKAPAAAAASEPVEAKPVYEDMHSQALKRHLKLAYATLEAAGIDFEPVAAGAGVNARMVEFLNENT